MDVENKQEVVERVASLMEVAETVLQQKFGVMSRDQVLNSPLFASMVGNLINSDPVLYDLLEGEEED